MAAGLTDKLRKVGTGTLTTLASPGKALAAVSINVGSTANYPTDTGIIIAIRTVDTDGEEVAGTYTEWKATVSSATALTIDATPVKGSDQVYAAGSTTQVFIPVSSYAHNDLMDALLATLNQDGTLKSAIVTYSKIATKYRQGWDTLAASGTRASAVQFTVTGDVTSMLRVGQPVEFTDTTTKYGNVASYSYSAGTGLTTINLFANSDYALVGNPTNIYIGLHANPVGFPGWFNASITFDTATIDNGSGGQPTTNKCRFKAEGNKGIIEFEGTGTKAADNNYINITRANMPLPIKTASYSDYSIVGKCYVLDPIAGTPDYVGNLIYYVTNTHFYLTFMGTISDNRSMTAVSFRAEFEI